MDWKKQLEKYELEKDWKFAITLMHETISDNYDDVEAHVRLIYLLHNILVEEDYPESERDQISMLLKFSFEESLNNFIDNAEYLFFVGKILYISEWHFGINDDLKPVQERRAFHMQMKAFEKDPTNILFEWAYRLSLNDELATNLAKQILYTEAQIEWLNSKGFPGKYILESLRSIN